MDPTPAAAAPAVLETVAPRMPVLALIGRPNVGKSTLFNQLTRTRDAIVSDLPGVTRDRRYGICRNLGVPVLVIDTGGLGEPDLKLAAEVERQSRLAIAEADLLVLMIDARAGLLSADHALAKEARSSGKAVLLAVNKADGLDADQVHAEASVLGLPTVLLSASHRQNFDELFEQCIALLEIDPDQAPAPIPGASDNAPIRVAVIGRPNVGKSTLINRLAGEERMLAADLPGTTRDSIDVRVERDDKVYIFVDTAGIRRRARVEEAVEKFSIIKALQALEYADVTIIVIDAQAGVTDQDATVLGHALDAGRGLILAINKWDGLERHQRTAVESELDRRLDFVPYAPRVPISALHGSGLGELLKLVCTVHRSASREFTPSDLTEMMNQAMERFQPPMVKGRAAKFRYAHQGGRNPPRIVVHGTRLDSLPDSYKRYLENQVREHYKLIGTPVRLEFRGGTNPFAGRVNPLTDRQVRKKRRLIRHAKR